MGSDDYLDGVASASDELKSKACFLKTQPMCNHLVNRDGACLNDLQCLLVVGWTASI